jgi:hypothetical protein
MQAVVKTPRIEINIRGSAIPRKLIKVLQEEFGPDLNLVEENNGKTTVSKNNGAEKQRCQV